MLKKKDLSEEQIKEIRAFYREGHTAGEVGDRFDISIHVAKKLCKGQRSWRLNQYSCPNFDNVANIKNKIAERLPKFEYVGNYTGSEATCDIRCKECGTVRTASSVAIRHGSLRCVACYERELAERNKRKIAEAEERKKQREEQKRQTILRREEKKKQERLDHISVFSCEVCGAMFLADDRHKNRFCGDVCARRSRNKQKELNRRIKIENQMVDRDISLERLYQRDGGICYLCGRVCDWNDREVVDGTVICGDTYPSIDHFVPLSKNGKHSWANVKLACRKCNSNKRDSLIEIDKKRA